MYRVIWELSDGDTQGQSIEFESLNEAIEKLSAKAREIEVGEEQGLNWIQIVSAKWMHPDPQDKRVIVEFSRKLSLLELKGVETILNGALGA